MEIYSIETGNFKLDGGGMFGVVPKTLWSKRYPCDENNLCNFSLRSMLVVDGNRRILIDNGIGNKQGEDFFRHFYLNGEATMEKSLLKIGYRCNDITDVVFTHLHFDHCGGAVQYNPDRLRFELVFPNATHWVSRGQWKNYLKPNIREADAYFKENIMPVHDAGKLKFIEKSGKLFPNFKIQIVNGHTPGLMVPIVHYKTKTIVFGGDFIPTAANVSVKWLASYDLQPVVSLKEKEDFLNEAVDNNYIIFFQHDLYNECCSLKRNSKGIQVDRCFTLDEAKQA